jgi:hypothetical protein
MRTIYLVLGILLLGIGVAGFLMPSAVFGVFSIDALHNIVHIASGALTLLAAARGIGAMRSLGRLFGAVYGGLGVLGLIWPDLFGLMHLTGADHVLHFALAAAFLYVGLLAPPKL